jgi:hypothetical protein
MNRWQKMDVKTDTVINSKYGFVVYVIVMLGAAYLMR